jgi:hypothetical protein
VKKETFNKIFHYKKYCKKPTEQQQKILIGVEFLLYVNNLELEWSLKNKIAFTSD